MPNEHTLSEAVAALFRRTTDGIRPGLEIERALLDRLGRPEESLPMIHVAGTNGKGTVCALLEAALRGAGLRTGLYTSPHLVRFHERFRVNGICIADEELADLIQEVARADERLQADGYRRATFFEYGTAMALLYFARRGVQAAVIETGMGGRWDATNVITPLLSVITRIDLDHVDYLGRTRRAIAREKAGIIKPRRPLVCGNMPRDAADVLIEQGQDKGAPLTWAAETVTITRRSQDEEGQLLRIESQRTTYGNVRFPLTGRHQMENAATALAALEVLDDLLGVALAEQGVHNGWSSVDWPARCQLLGRKPTLLLDGAHNPGGAAALAATLRELARGRPLGLVLGFLGDKDVAGCLEHLARVACRCWAVPVDSPRGMQPEALAELARRAGLETETGSIDEALQRSAAWAGNTSGILCAAGSLYLAGTLLRHYGIKPYQQRTV